MQVWLQCTEMIIQKKSSNTVFSDFWFLQHVLVGGGGGSKGKSEELIHVFDCWIWAMCGVVLLQSLCSDHSLSVLVLNCKPSSCRSHSLIFWVKNSYNLWSILELFPNREGGRKRLVVPLLWIIHPILPAWVQSDPFAWPLLGLGRRAGCLPYLRWLLGLIGALNTHKHTLSRVRGQPTHCDLKFDSFYSFHVGWPHFSLGNCLAWCLCLGCTVLQEPGWSPLNTGDSNVPLHRCTLWPYIPYPELPPSITRENEKQEQLLSDQPPSLCHLKTLEDAHF